MGQVCTGVRVWSWQKAVTDFNFDVFKHSFLSWRSTMFLWCLWSFSGLISQGFTLWVSVLTLLGTGSQYASSFPIVSPEPTPRMENGDPSPAAGLSVCLCFPAQELIPSLRELERLLEAAEKLWCRGSNWTDCPLEAAKFHFPDWKTDFQENFSF